MTSEIFVGLSQLKSFKNNLREKYYEWDDIYDYNVIIKLLEDNGIPLQGLVILQQDLKRELGSSNTITGEKKYSNPLFSKEKLLRKLDVAIEITENYYNSENVESNSGFTLMNLLNNFNIFVQQLQSRHDKRASIQITDEYDVQDLLHSVLRLHYEDVRSEEYTPSYAGKSSRTDFLLKEEQIFIEVKCTRKNLTDRELGKEIILDASYYNEHPDCNELYVLIYDLNRSIKNPIGLINDLQKQKVKNNSIKVIIANHLI